MPSGSKKRKSARRKKVQENLKNNESAFQGGDDGLDLDPIKETPESVSNENGDRNEGLHSNKELLSEVPAANYVVATVQEKSELALSNENVNSLNPSAEEDVMNLPLIQIVKDVECLKMNVVEGLHSQDKLRTLLQNLLDALNNFQMIVKE